MKLTREEGEFLGEVALTVPWETAPRALALLGYFGLILTVLAYKFLELSFESGPLWLDDSTGQINLGIGAVVALYGCLWVTILIRLGLHVHRWLDTGSPAIVAGEGGVRHHGLWLWPIRTEWSDLARIEVLGERRLVLRTRAELPWHRRLTGFAWRPDLVLVKSGEAKELGYRLEELRTSAERPAPPLQPAPEAAEPVPEGG